MTKFIHNIKFVGQLVSLNSSHKILISKKFEEISKISWHYKKKLQACFWFQKIHVQFIRNNGRLVFIGTSKQQSGVKILPCPKQLPHNQKLVMTKKEDVNVDDKKAYVLASTAPNQLSLLNGLL